METRSDAKRLNVIASANGLNISPTEPDTKTSGKNTTIVTKVEDMIGLNTSVVAFIIKFSPFIVSLESDSLR